MHFKFDLNSYFLVTNLLTFVELTSFVTFCSNLSNEMTEMLFEEQATSLFFLLLCLAIELNYLYSVI